MRSEIVVSDESSFLMTKKLKNTYERMFVFYPDGEKSSLQTVKKQKTESKG